MDIWRQRSNVTYYSESPLRFTISLLVLTGGVAVAAVPAAAGDYRNAIVLAAVSLAAALLLSAPIEIQTVLLIWFATTPLASFYLRFPANRSIITYNRAVFASLVIVVLVESYTSFRKTSASTATSPAKLRAPELLSLSRFEIAWALLSLLAITSTVARSNNIAYATRLAVDTFWLPLFAFHFSRKCFDLRTGGRWLLLGCMVLALLLFVTGAFELVTGIDLIHYKGAELVREGERRVNGPFLADSSFAIICLILFLFLQTAPRLLRVCFDRTGKLVYVCATAAAALGALLSLFRSVAFALVICWIVQRWYSRRARKLADLRRLVAFATLTAVILILIGGGLAVINPSGSGSRLANPRSVFGRLATWKAAAQVAVDNPVFGVGLANYADYYDESHYYSDEPPEEVLATKAAQSPHSNLLWIASELGLPGLLLYIAANLYLFLMGWRALKRSRDSTHRIAASCFLAIVVAYWIPGLVLASGYYSDLNLYFLFLLGALSSGFSESLPIPEHSQVTDEF
jgi:O-antigen ligase